MTQHIRIVALLTAMLLGLAALGAPTQASAGGGITVMLTPQGESADLIQQGLQIYSIVKQLKKGNHAQVDQKGHGNAAVISQRGVDNYGLVYQRGRNHTASIAQEGWNNALGVFQFGRNTSFDAVQFGQGQTGLVLQGGW